MCLRLLATPRCVAPQRPRSVFITHRDSRTRSAGRAGIEQRVRVTVFGATGSIGREVVERALAAGHDVHAYVRDEAADLPGHVTRTVGDLGDADAVAAAIAGSDAVIWAVGASRNHPDDVPVFERGARNVVAAMGRNGVRRLIALSGAGVTLRGERKPLAGRLMSAIVARLAKHVVEAKRREYEVFSASGLDWTLVRPPRVVPGALTGGYRAGTDLAGRTITQGDLADFFVQQLDDRTYIRAAPYVASRANVVSEGRS